MSMADANITDAGRCSGGVGVGARLHIGMARDGVQCGSRALAGRYVRRWLGAICRGGIHCACIYLHTAQGLSDANLECLDQVAAGLAAMEGPWILAGDFNVTPEQLAASGWLELTKGVIVAPTRPTCNERVLDFFVVSECLAHAVKGAAVITDAYCGPHYAVRLYLSGQPRATHQRRLRAPTKIAAELPQGCLPRAAAEAQAWQGREDIDDEAWRRRPE